MKVTMTFPMGAKKHILTSRGTLRPEVIKDLETMIIGRYSMGGSAYDSVFDRPDKFLEIRISETLEDWRPPHETETQTADEN